MTSREEIDTFKGHQLWDRVKKIRDEFGRSTPRSATDRETIARVLATMTYLGEFHNMPAALIPSSRVAVADQLTQALSSIESQWQGWDQDAAMTPSTVQQLDALCDQIMAYLRDHAWPPLQKESRAAAIKGAAEAYQTAADTALTGLSAAVDEQEARLATATASVDEIAAQVESLRTEARTALESIEATRDAQAENAAEQLQAELGKMNQAAKSQRDRFQSEFEGSHESWISSADAAIERLQEDAATGERLVQYVGDQTTAGGYLKFADREKRSYRLWITAGTVAIAVAAIYLYIQFQEYKNDTAPGVALVAFKAALSLTVIAFSGFCFREAGKRQRQSLEARYRALDLLALRPYTNDLDEADKRVFRELLGQRLFGRSPEERHGKSDEKVTTLRLDIADVKSVLDTAKTAKDLTGM